MLALVTRKFRNLNFFRGFRLCELSLRIVLVYSLNIILLSLNLYSINWFEFLFPRNSQKKKKNPGLLRFGFHELVRSISSRSVCPFHLMRSLQQLPRWLILVILWSSSFKIQHIIIHVGFPQTLQNLASFFLANDSLNYPWFPFVTLSTSL